MEQIAIFCDIDDFCKDYEEYCTHSLLMDKNEVVPKTKMALSEIMTIVIMYHLSGYRTFKHYYSLLPKKPSICAVSDIPNGILCLVD